MVQPESRSSVAWWWCISFAIPSENGAWSRSSPSRLSGQSSGRPCPPLVSTMVLQDTTQVDFLIIVVGLQISTTMYSAIHFQSSPSPAYHSNQEGCVEALEETQVRDWSTHGGQCNLQSLPATDDWRLCPVEHPAEGSVICPVDCPVNAEGSTYSLARSLHSDTQACLLHGNIEIRVIVKLSSSSSRLSWKVNMRTARLKLQYTRLPRS